MIEIVEHQIDTNRLLTSVAHPDAGANLLFVGTTRRFTGELETTQLNYDCYRAMAQTKLQEISAEAQNRWQLTACNIVHRIGNVPVGEASLAVAISSAHRNEAFEAGKWVIETLKQVVPIWKQEVFKDGRTSWVHPGVEKPTIVE